MRFVKKTVKALLPYGLLCFYRKINKKRLQKCDNEYKQRVRKDLYFEVHITEHCNLNCAGCSHFSSIAKEEYIDLDVFERDLARLSKITNKKVAYIKLLGGEPLLHPNAAEIINIARKYFDKYTNIILLTNGILLSRQKEEFWESAARNNVWIAITNYPIKLDLDAIRELSTSYGVPCGYFCGPAAITDFAEDTSGGKDMYRFPFDLNGGQNMEKSFTYCPKSNSCFTLRDGRLYTCSSLAHIKHFNEFFCKQLPVTEDDYIDIYKAESREEILNFLAKPVPFCRFCKTCAITCGHKWETTKKDISEWT